MSATKLFKIASILQYPIYQFFNNYTCDHGELIDNKNKPFVK
ncbi:hypothetical protein [Proteus mirabilis]